MAGWWTSTCQDWEERATNQDDSQGGSGELDTDQGWQGGWGEHGASQSHWQDGWEKHGTDQGHSQDRWGQYGADQGNLRDRRHPSESATGPSTGRSTRWIPPVTPSAQSGKGLFHQVLKSFRDGEYQDNFAFWLRFTHLQLSCFLTWGTFCSQYR